MSSRILCTIAGSLIHWDDTCLSFTAGMAIDADGAPKAYHPKNIGLEDNVNGKDSKGKWVGVVTVKGKPFLHADGYYVSTTSYTREGYEATDRRRYLDSTLIPYIVVPPRLRKEVPGIVLGCRAVVTNTSNGKTCEAVVGDLGPARKVGEGSMALATALGIPANPRRGGTKAHVIRYEIFPGQQVTIAGETFRLIPA